MEEDIVRKLTIKERIIVKIFKKTFKKVYTFTRVEIINRMLQVK